LIAGVIVSLAMTGIFGNVSFAADKAVDAKPAVTTEAKAPEAKAEKKVVKKKKKAKKAKKVAKKAEAKTEAAAPEAGK